MTQATVCVTEFQVTDEMRVRYRQWVDWVVAGTAMPPEDLLVEHEPWMHPLDAIAVITSHTGGALSPEDRPLHRDALRTSAGLSDSERLDWVARALGMTREQAKWYLPEQPARDLSGPTALYRYYDANDRLLYVGITASPDTRDRTHQKRSEWYVHVVRRTVEWHVGRASALAAERAAIKDELPVFNRQGSRIDPDEVDEYLMWADLAH